MQLPLCKVIRLHWGACVLLVPYSTCCHVHSVGAPVAVVAAAPRIISNGQQRNFYNHSIES